MDVCINGVSQSASEKNSYFDFSNINANTGGLAISKNYNDETFGDDTNMKLDDVIIWEVKLLYQDVIQLYQAY